MKILKRAGVLALGTALLVVVGHATAEAQNKEIRGLAVAVSDSSLTLKAGEQTLTFVIEKGTLVEAKGASTEDAPSGGCRQESRNQGHRLRESRGSRARELPTG